MSAEGEEQLSRYEQLKHAAGELNEKISSGERADLAAIDEYLRIIRDRELELSNIEPPKRERHMRRAARYETILNGSYAEEKAKFCRDEAAMHEEVALYTEKAKYDPTQPAMKYSDESIADERKRAANWYRRAADCLEAPESVHDNIPPQEQI